MDETRQRDAPDAVQYDQTLISKVEISGGPGLTSEADRAFFEPFVTEQGPLQGRPPANDPTVGGRSMRDAVSWIAHTGTPFRDLPEQLVSESRYTGNIVVTRSIYYGI